MADGQKKHKTVTNLVFAGAAILVVGILIAAFSTFLFIGAGIVIGILMVPVGIALIVLGMSAGWREAFGDPSKRPIERANNVYVVAKLVTDKRAEPVIDPDYHDVEDLRHLVQIQVDGKGKIEFETAPEVFSGIGEGMRGDIVYQGRWLSQFTFRPKESDRPVGDDPFATRRP